MKARFAIIAALPREVAGLVKGVTPDAELRRRKIFLYRMSEVVVVAAGMGTERAGLAVGAALAAGEVTDLLSVGLAGSCHPALTPGTVVEAHVVVDTMTGERFECDAKSSDGRALTLATTQEIASVAEKSRLALSYQAVMVDMEAATVARLARAHGLRFRAIKAISDGHDAELDYLSNFTGKHGTFRTGRFAFHIMLRPWTWARSMELGRNSAEAIDALDQALKLTLALHQVDFGR